jgi:hypothetical protein
VIAIALGPDKQDQQNVRKLRGLNAERWEQLVELIDRAGNSAALNDICQLLELDPQKQEVEAIAARSNMTAIVRMLHDKSSQLMDMLIHALSKGKLCVIDVSQMRGGQALVLSGLILRRIFDRNQTEFTSAEPKTIPTIAVVEEAQSVLNEKATSSEPYIEWVKEGRKYDLGAVLITQQPGSIPHEILSQGDNWFIFHLLSSGDLAALRKANAHFSEDLLSSLLNEPIPGQGVFWSSVKGKPYPIPLRVLSFEERFTRADPAYSRPAGETFAQELKATFAGIVPVQPKPVSPAPATPSTEEFVLSAPEPPEEGGVDVLRRIEHETIAALRKEEKLIAKLQSPSGAAWGEVKATLLKHLPPTLDDADTVAYHLVRKAMTEMFGPQGTAWESYKNPERNNTTYVRLRR